MEEADNKTETVHLIGWVTSNTRSWRCLDGGQWRAYEGVVLFFPHEATVVNVSLVFLLVCPFKHVCVCVCVCDS